jgi:hypothetical protein
MLNNFYIIKNIFNILLWGYLKNGSHLIDPTPELLVFG